LSIGTRIFKIAEFFPFRDTFRPIALDELLLLLVCHFSRAHKETVAVLGGEVNRVLTVAVVQGLLSPSHLILVHVQAVVTPFWNSGELVAVVFSLMEQCVTRVHVVLPQPLLVVVIHAELSGVLLQKLIHPYRALLVSLGCLALGQATELLNLLALSLVIGDLTQHSSFDLALGDESKLMSWQESWSLLQSVCQVRVHVVFQRLRLLCSQNVDVLFYNTEKDTNTQKDLQVELCPVQQRNILLRVGTDIILKLVEILSLISEEFDTFLKLEELEASLFNLFHHGFGLLFLFSAGEKLIFLVHIGGVLLVLFISWDNLLGIDVDLDHGRVYLK
jgi:hypothetical protein